MADKGAIRKCVDFLFGEAHADWFEDLERAYREFLDFRKRFAERMKRESVDPRIVNIFIDTLFGNPQAYFGLFFNKEKALDEAFGDFMATVEKGELPARGERPTRPTTRPATAPAGSDLPTS